MKIKKIRIKLLLNFLSVGLVPLIILMFLGFWFAGKLLKEKNFEQLNAIREYKKQTIEDYFQLVRNEIQYLSENQTIISAMKEFKEAFHAPTKLSLEEKSIAKVKDYYKNKIFKQLGNSLSNFEKNRLIPQDSVTLFFQRYYMAEMSAVKKAHPYHNVHNKYHQDISDFLKKFKYYDILLIDNESGHIIYSVDKEIDFATSLKSGSFSQSNIANVYQEVKQAREPGFVKIYDFEQYAPSLMYPAMFIGAPIFDGKKNIGTLVFELSTKEIDRTMTNERKWKQVGLGNTGESYIVGRDSKMRNDTRAIIEDPKAFFKLLTELKYNAQHIENMRRFNSSILFQEIKTEAVKDAYLGRTNAKITTDYRGKKVLTSYSPLQIPDLEWYLVTKIDEEEIMGPMDKFAYRIMVGILILLAIILIITWFLSKNISKPIQDLEQATKDIQAGSYDTRIEVTSQDEIGKLANSFNQMANNLKEQNESLVKEQQKLEVSKQALEARQWLSNGVVEFLPILQREDNNLLGMAQDILSHLTKYVQAMQAAIYITHNTASQENGTSQAYLELLAHRAHNKAYTAETKIALGEGLVGTCALNKEIIHLEPDEEVYDIITSATFNAKPTTILLVPLLNNQRLVGVLELTYLRKLNDNDIAFVKRVGERIGLAIYNMQADILTKNLLEEVQLQNDKLSSKEEILSKNAEELKRLNDSLEERVNAATKDIQEKNQRLVTQEEELRQNLEELNAINDSLDQKVEERTQELKDKEEVLVKNLESLKASQLAQHKLSLMLDTTHDFVILTSIEGQVTYMNKAGRALKGLTEDAAIHHLTFMDFKVEEDTTDLIGEVMPIVAQEGVWKGELKQKHLSQNKVIDVDTTIFPVIDSETQEWICFAMIQRDITEQKAAQNKLVQQEEELRQNADELQALNESLEERVKLAIKDVREKNQQLLSQEEELRQNLEELNTLNESLDHKVEERTQELKAKEEILRKNLESLKQSQLEQQKLALMLDNTEDFVVLTNIEGQVVYINQSGRKARGIDDEVDITTLSFMDFKVEEDTTDLIGEVMPAVAQNGNWEGELKQRNFHNGELLDVHTSVFPVKDINTQEWICFAMIQRDITAQKAAQNKLLQQEEELRQNAEELQTLNESLAQRIETATLDIKQKNQRLLAQEDQLKQNIEELNSLNESLDEKVAERTQELVDKEKLLQKNLANLHEAQIEQRKLATMIDNSDDMIVMVGFDGKVVYMNRQARKVWGIGEDAEITHLGIDEFEMRNTRGRTISLFNTIFPKVAEEGYWMGEFIQYCKLTGEDINVESKIFTVIDESSQQPICIAAIQRDITERKKAQVKLQKAYEASKRSRELIQAVIDATPDWIFVKDRDYKYIMCNRSFARAFNRTKKQVLGENDYTLGFAQELIEGNEEIGLKGFREDDRRVLEHEHFVHNTNDPGIQINGDLRFFDTQKLPLFDSTGQVYAVLAIARDFTDRKIFENKLQSKNTEITQQQQNIRASISYAKRIQNALLPKKSYIEESFPDSFILFKPRDIVSGDFYWFAQTDAKPVYEEVSSFEGVEKVFSGFKNEKILISAVDCTGHGVPGAFMSLIGNDILNEIVVQNEITDPDQILSYLHQGVRKMLKQQENSISDGMDMALCTFDMDEQILEFAGAKNPLVYIQDGQLQEVKGSKYPIGGREQGKSREYTKHTIDISKPTTIYLYSDGYQDQFGGPNKQKFMKKRLRQLLLQIHQKPMAEQQQILDETFTQWMNEADERQIDDVLVIGIRV